MSKGTIDPFPRFALATSVPQRRKNSTQAYLQQPGIGDVVQFMEGIIIADPPYMPGSAASPPTTAAATQSGHEQDRPLALGQRARPTVTRVPDAPLAEYRFALLQQWEGVVRELGPAEFTAVLRDLTNPAQPEEEVVLSFDDVTPDDQKLLAPGGIFYWSIGYRKERTGQVDRVSTIRFRRLPAWSRRDLQRLNDRAKALMERFGDTTTNTDTRVG
jgi:hypothetical protein